MITTGDKPQKRGQVANTLLSVPFCVPVNYLATKLFCAMELERLKLSSTQVRLTNKSSTVKTPLSSEACRVTDVLDYLDKGSDGAFTVEHDNIVHVYRAMRLFPPACADRFPTAFSNDTASLLHAAVLRLIEQHAKHAHCTFQLCNVINSKNNTSSSSSSTSSTQTQEKCSCSMFYLQYREPSQSELATLDDVCSSAVWQRNLELWSRCQGFPPKDVVSTLCAVLTGAAYDSLCSKQSKEIVFGVNTNIKAFKGASSFYDDCRQHLGAAYHAFKHQSIDDRVQLKKSFGTELQLPLLRCGSAAITHDSSHTKDSHTKDSHTKDSHSICVKVKLLDVAHVHPTSKVWFLPQNVLLERAMRLHTSTPKSFCNLFKRLANEEEQAYVSRLLQAKQDEVYRRQAMTSCFTLALPKYVVRFHPRNFELVVLQKLESTQASQDSQASSRWSFAHGKNELRLFGNCLALNKYGTQCGNATRHPDLQIHDTANHSQTHNGFFCFQHSAMFDAYVSDISSKTSSKPLKGGIASSGLGLSLKKLALPNETSAPSVLRQVVTSFEQATTKSYLKSVTNNLGNLNNLNNLNNLSKPNTPNTLNNLQAFFMQMQQANRDYTFFRDLQSYFKQAIMLQDPLAESTLSDQVAGPGVFGILELGVLQALHFDLRLLKPANLTHTPASPATTSSNVQNIKNIMGGSKTLKWTLVCSDKEHPDVLAAKQHLETNKQNNIRHKPALRSFRAPLKLQDEHLVVFTPEGECVGTLSDLRDLYFGKVEYYFDDDFPESDRDIVRDIIARYVGLSGKYITWCTFVEVTKAKPVAHADSAMRVELQLKSSPEIVAKTSQEFDHLSVTQYVQGSLTALVMLNKDNWRFVKHFNVNDRNQDSYRLYVVVHELYHAVRVIHHIDIEAYHNKPSNRPLQIMSQQTRSTFFEQNLGTAPTFVKATCCAKKTNKTDEVLLNRQSLLHDVFPKSMRAAPASIFDAKYLQGGGYYDGQTPYYCYTSGTSGTPSNKDVQAVGSFGGGKVQEPLEHPDKTAKDVVDALLNKQFEAKPNNSNK